MTPRSLVLLSFFMVMTFAVAAQPGGGGDPGGGEPVPFSGLEILLTAGAALGVKSLHTMRKRTRRN